MIYEIILFAALVISNFTFVLLMVVLGKEYLYSYAMLAGALIVLLSPINIDIFGFPFALVEILFATFFLITDVLSELYDKQAARKSLLSALLGMAVVFVFIKIGLLITPGEFDLSDGYLETVASMFTPFAFFVVVVAFAVEQTIDITNFDLIKQYTSGKYLWLRNCLSTMTTQSLDVLVVYPVFFYPILGDAVLKLMVAAVVFKIIIALIDTPFIYLARHLNNKYSQKLST